ncbi:hypothetical protein IJI89_03940 [Candidatus Saccharibacteria bacterium]|nr:hypothetical protein [Candidatus Saccharibacteria bacterium]
MAFSGTLLTIGSTAISGLRSYSVQYNKLWKDAERNMAGNISASLIGVFPKLLLTFRDGLTENEVSSIAALLNQDYFSVTYFDPQSKATKTANYYAGDYELPMLDKARGLYKSFSVNLIPVSKRV